MRLLWVSAVVIAVGFPVAAFAQASQSIMEGQATAVQLTRAQALRDLAQAGYRNVTKLTLGMEGTWTAMTAQGAVKVSPSGDVSRAQ